MTVELVSQPIDIAGLTRALSRPDSGAVVTFTGTVRDNARGKRVLRLEYSAYEEMARGVMEELVAEARHRFPVTAVVLVHRVGELAVGDASVFIGVAAPHRAEAFAACRFLIDELKEKVPIWKKEHYADGEQWIEGDDGALPGGGGHRQ